MHPSPGILEKSCCPLSTSPVTWMINDSWRNDVYVRFFFCVASRVIHTCTHMSIMSISPIRMLIGETAT